MTHGGYDLLKEKAKGRIQKGYFADLVVLDADYFHSEHEKIKSIRSVLTVVNGKIVYGSKELETIAPPPLAVIPSWSPVHYYGGYQN